MPAPRSRAAGNAQTFRFIGLSDEDGIRWQEVLDPGKDLGSGGNARGKARCPIPG